MARTSLVTVAFGHAARESASRLLSSAVKWLPDTPRFVIGDEKLPGAQLLRCDDPGWGARRAKLAMLDLVPEEFGRVLYFDADTEIISDIAPALAILDDGWDVLIAPSQNQDHDVFCHVQKDERLETLQSIPFPLQLQAGVMFIARNVRTRALFDTWQREQARFGRHDQAALIRALQSSPVRIWILSEDFNHGAIVEHHFGEAR